MMMLHDIGRDEKVWTESGQEMTGIALGHPGTKCLQVLINWLDENTKGEYVITPTRIFFEHGSEATMFKLKFA